MTGANDVRREGDKAKGSEMSQLDAWSKISLAMLMAGASELQEIEQDNLSGRLVSDRDYLSRIYVAMRRLEKSS